MTKLRMLALACGVTLAVAPLAPGQDKTPPIQKKELKKDTFDELLKSYQQGATYASYRSGDQVLNTGDFVTVNTKGEGKVTGVFVWADPKSGRLYIRTRAGLPPIGVPARDADKIERIAPASGTAPKNGIRPAIEMDQTPAQAGQGGPEIHTMTVRNGPSTSTFFYDNSLSAAERDQLGAIEKAGGDLVQKSNTVDTLRQALQNAASDNGTSVVQGGYGAYPYYYPLAYYNPFYYYNPYYGFFGGAYGASARASPALTAAMAATAPAARASSFRTPAAAAARALPQWRRA